MATDYMDQWNINGVQVDVHDAGRAQPNGVATLDSSGRIPASQLPETALEYKGTWDASTNTPTLADGIGTKGDLYVCSVGGSVDFGSGTAIAFLPNDRVVYNGTIWEKLSGGEVKTVNGVTPDSATGNVQLGYTLNVGDILTRAKGAPAPARATLCDGSEVSKTTYAGLYAVIGDTYGTPEDASNFVLPTVTDADSYFDYYIIYE